ncbi:hypothetical protein [Nocardioides jejuensis]|uniref:DUF11 domain-containing protein n=1 Tax=Nocardioides jejuensis TaxID=2502782 RepID=A0A4R1CJ73_9ACTN|nr:hypothetical protein [Nocardioides jejuensis]TCJ30226.1 hypothetical protein EPD65_04900 [Nocardioides jejuensis]
MEQRSTRRALVRGAATTAWLVPAVTVASAVPAIAASTPAKFSLVGTATSQINSVLLVPTSKTFTITSTVKNTGGTTGVPTIDISFGLLSANLAVPTVAGWTGSFTLLSGGITGLRYTYNGTVAPGASVPFNFSITSTLLLAATMTATVTPPDTSQPTTITKT